MLGGPARTTDWACQRSPSIRMTGTRFLCWSKPFARENGSICFSIACHERILIFLRRISHETQLYFFRLPLPSRGHTIHDLSKPFFFLAVGGAEALQRDVIAGTNLILEAVPFGLRTAFLVIATAVHFNDQALGTCRLCVDDKIPLQTITII